MCSRLRTPSQNSTLVRPRAMTALPRNTLDMPVVPFTNPFVIYSICAWLGNMSPIFSARAFRYPFTKGKNICSLDPDNYRGITLLATYNKLCEVLIWGRIKKWWFEERVTSDLQGAGRPVSLCIHTALTLQETISKEREGNRNVFLAYYDISKAFDSV